MKLTIKEIKEKCENDDKVNFKGIVDKVWDFNEKETKYSIGYQNIIVKDDTDKIKVIFSKIKTKADIYSTSIEGKAVEVSGKVTIYKGETNVFGKLIFEEKEGLKDPTGVKSGISQKPATELSIAGGITEEEIRLKCLSIALAIYRGDSPNSTDVIRMANIFEKYVCQGTLNVTQKPTTGEKEEKPKPETGKQKNDSGNGEELSPEHIKKINLLMALAENRGKEGKVYLNDLIVVKGYKTIKEFLDEDIKEATDKLERMGTEEIPF